MMRKEIFHRKMWCEAGVGSTLRFHTKCSRYSVMDLTGTNTGEILKNFTMLGVGYIKFAAFHHNNKN